MWDQYAEVGDHHQNFMMQKIVTLLADIYPVFHELFKKQPK
ncbi:YeaH/YhbH family protein [Massilia sp. H-1]|nr:YeaH/YhbH family protein [Massilia sp. H-1]